MSNVRRAFHLRTGEPGAAEAVEAWLHDHQVESTLLFDAYDACVYLLEHNDQVPDLVFVGTDWLAPDEIQIINYIRETWPGSGIVVYSSSDDAPPLQPTPPTCICRSPAALLELMIEPPAEVLRHLRTHTSVETMHAVHAAPATAVHPQSTGADANSAPAVRKKHSPKKKRQRTDSAHKDEVSEKDGTHPEKSSSRGVLTSDEIAALLEDQKD
ncbi:MAG: hypothetical protein ABIG44_15930 [Planctomycetota bacterium]